MTKLLFLGEQILSHGFLLKLSILKEVGTVVPIFFLFNDFIYLPILI